MFAYQMLIQQFIICARNPWRLRQIAHKSPTVSTDHNGRTVLRIDEGACNQSSAYLRRGPWVGSGRDGWGGGIEITKKLGMWVGERWRGRGGGEVEKKWLK